MDTAAPTDATILIVTDTTTDATLVKNLLSPEFEHVFTSTDSINLPGDFVRHRPSVLVLAFNSLEKAELHYLGLYRLCKEVHQYPHRTLILCNKDEMKRAYELCKKEYFDDYILFWPMTHDALRLPMSVHCALRELAALKSDGPSAAEFAVQARHLAELEKILSQQVGQGGQHIEATSRAMEQAEQEIGAALDGFSQRLNSDLLPGSGAANNVNEIKNEVDRFKREGINQQFRTVAESTRTLKQWAHEFKRECEPLLESARALNAMAERIRPIVLVVDDDEYQHKIIAKLLEEESYHLVFAAGGVEVLSILRKIRPDLILMDVMMPDMDGLEVVRQMKRVPMLAGIPIIMITGKSEKNIVMESLKAGAIDFVVKPFDRDTLLDKLRQLLH